MPKDEYNPLRDTELGGDRLRAGAAEARRLDIRAADLLPARRPVAPDSPSPGPDTGIPADEPDTPAREAERPYALRTIKALTPESEAAAILEAWGASRAEISRELSVNVGTISVWRRSQVYIDRRALETEKVVADSKNRMQRVRQRAFELREKMYDRLDELLDAEDENGNPQAGIVIEAAKLIVADKAATSDFAETVDVNATVHGAVFHVVDGEVRTTAGDVVEGEAEEVAELEHPDAGS